MKSCRSANQADGRLFFRSMTEALAATSPAASTSSTLVQHHLRTHRLSAKQERNLIDFVDEKLLDVTRNYKKRCARCIYSGVQEAMLSCRQAPTILVSPNPPRLPIRNPYPPRPNPSDPTRSSTAHAPHSAAPAPHRRGSQLDNGIRAGCRDATRAD